MSSKLNLLTERQPDIVCFLETWCYTHEEVKRQVPSSYDVIECSAVREAQYGRFKSGILLCIKKQFMKNVKIIQKNTYSILISLSEQSVSQEDLYIYFVYNNSATAKSELTECIFETLNSISSETVLCMGDFNARTGNDNSEISVYEEFHIDEKVIFPTRRSKDTYRSTKGSELLKGASESSYIILNGRTNSDPFGEFTFVSHLGSSVVDYGIISLQAASQIKDFRVLETSESDHFPIEIELLHSETPRHPTIIYESKPYIKWNNQNSKNFSQKCKTEWVNSEKNPTTCTLDKIRGLIYKCAEECGMLFRPTRRRNKKIYCVWFDKECQHLKRIMLQKLRIFRKSNSNRSFNYTEDLQIYLNAKKQYFDTRRLKKDEFISQIVQKIASCENSKEYWEAINIFRNRRSTPVDSSIIELKEWHEHFTKTFSEQTNNETNRISSENIVDVEMNEWLDCDFSLFDLNRAIKKLKNNKSTGVDGIPNEIWKNLPLVVKESLLNFFNTIFMGDAELPSDWCDIILCPIFKKGDNQIPSNYRPIALANSVLKLFTSMMCDRLNNWCKRFNKISEFQAAYKEGTGCEEHIFILQSIINYQLRLTRSKVYVCFIDLSGAFDSIIHALLWTKLNNKGVSDKFLNIIKRTYSVANALVRTSNGVSDKIKIEKSVLQGEVLSPKLFTLYIDDIVDELEKSGIHGIQLGMYAVHLLLYADDIALIATTPEDLQRKINVVDEYFQRNKLKVNLSKTKIVVFRKGCGRISEKIQFKWGDEPIEIVNKYTYLGVPFSCSGKFTVAREHFISKAKCATLSLTKLIESAKINELHTIKKLFQSLVKSVLLYSFPVWGLQSFEELSSFQIQFYRRLYYIPMEAPRWFIRLELGLDDINSHMLKLVMNFWMRIISKSETSLVRTVYNKLIDIGHMTKIDYNWTLQMEKLLKTCDCETLWKSQRYEFISRRLHTTLEKYKFRSVNDDVALMRDSKLTYKLIKNNVFASKFLNSNHSISVKRLIVQLRLSLSCICIDKSVKLLGCRTRGYSNCDICNLSDIEDVFHVMFVCPHYNSPRKSYLHKYGNNFNRLNYILLFQQLDNSKINDIFKFWKTAIRIRNFIRE